MDELNSAPASNPDPNDKADQFLIVGIGASAGGIEALQQFFQHVPADSGMAHVVILHLSPDHNSRLAEVLQQVTQIPVSQVRERIQVEPDHIYVVTPSQHLTMSGNDLEVSPNITIEDRRAPVDIFFRTLAEAQGPRAVCVVLSGTGANGSMGLKHVKERGGATYVQNPREASFNEMPRNAIATDLVDSILSVAEIPASLIAYKNNLGKIDIADEAEKRSEQQQQALREIFTQLRLRTGHDFSNYKRPTLLRRIERRINIRNLPDLPSYANYISKDHDEARALLKDLLISVTNFFRDKKAFSAVEQDVIPRLFEGKTARDQVRIWVVGCATGEEAYTLAMMCAEHKLGVIDAPEVQIFATDIDEAAIAQAREGYYTLNDAADVSPERLRQFFTKDGDGFRVRREIREMVLFAVHNVLKDPPFSHLDLVTCRNMLIYLNQTAQEQVMETLHFALNPGGHLFLGLSESAESASDLYSIVNRENRIYQSRVAKSRPYPSTEPSTSFRFEPIPSIRSSQERERRALERITYGELHVQLLEQYGPPSVVINEEYDIVHMSARAGRYMQISGGEPSNNLLKLVRSELRLDLRAGLYEAVQRRANFDIHNLKVRINDASAAGQADDASQGVEAVNLHIRPVLRPDDVARGLILVVFEPVTDAGAGVSESVMKATEESVVNQLEAELSRMKAQLRSSNEQYEYQTEELKASNEELQAMNEELRSAAEELETSKEELQSINEELRTVNQELKIKIEETTLTSNNLQNLINSSDIGTIFLDRGLRVNLFTPAARAIFNLIPGDYGRPLSDITNRLTDKNMIQDAEQVLEDLRSVERAVQTTDGQDYLMHVRPYRTAEDRIDGVVLTFVNVTALRQAESSLRESEERVRLILESIKDYAIFTTDPTGIINSWNEGSREMFGWTSDEALGQPSDLIFTPEDRAAGAPQREMRVARETGRAPDERFHLRKDGTRMYVSGIMSPLYKAGVLKGYVKIARDLTERNTMELQLREAHDLLEQRIQERTAQLNDTNQSRRALLRRMVMTQEEERTRIAHELHDSTAQRLTTFIYTLSMLKQSQDAEKMRDTLSGLLDTARDFMNDLHTMVQGLRPPLLDMFGLTSALQDYAQKWSTWSGIPAQVETRGTGDERYRPEIETTIYRIVQEALTNVARHGKGATLVTISLNRTDTEVMARVDDNGPGFDVSKLKDIPPEKRRLGIMGMQERAELLNGNLTIESQPGKGTAVVLRIPLGV